MKPSEMTNEELADNIEDTAKVLPEYGGFQCADELFEAAKRLRNSDNGIKMAKSIVRVVRDAVVSYNEMFPVAPNDDSERELRERAKIANDWLEFYGFDKEPFDY